MTRIMRRGLCVFGLLVCLAGSGVSAQKSESASGAPSSDFVGPVQFETRRFHKEYGHDCQGGQHPEVCVWFDLTYPEAISAPSEVAKTKINHAILQWVLEEFEGGGDAGGTFAKSQETLYQKFVNQERDYRSELSDRSLLGFWFERKVKVVYLSANVLSLSRDQEGDTGGANPTGRLDYANFRPSTGAPLLLEDILKPGFEKSLNAYGEVRFRALKHLDPLASFKEAGFNFEPNGFYLNEHNFTIGPKGLTFQYDEYEVSCFACGAPAVFLPYSGLRRLLRPDANIP